MAAKKAKSTKTKTAKTKTSATSAKKSSAKKSSAKKSSAKKSSAKKSSAKKSSAKKSREARFEEFQGFPKALFTFLKQLKKNNERDWFNDNKARFEANVKAPLEAFVGDASEELGAGKVFRIYRDVRFSKDKSPYKTHASAVFEGRGLVYYVHLESDSMFAATGYYQMAKDQRARFYEAVVDAKLGPQLVQLVEDAEDAEMEVGGEALKTAARGYDKDHERARFLRHKGLTVSRTWKPLPKWIHTKEAGERVLAFFREAAPLNDWLKSNVGPSEDGARFVR